MVEFPRAPTTTTTVGGEAMILKPATVRRVSLLPTPCVESPRQFSVIVWLPPTPGAYIIEHVALLTAFPGDRAQVAEDGEYNPVVLVTKLKVPVGVAGFDE